MRVWCLLRDQYAHVKPVEAYLGDTAEFIYDADWDPEQLIEARPDIILCVNDFHFEVTQCIDVARYEGIPSLVIQDGILEWRCQYENPAFGMGGGPPQHQPVIADKIACIGPQSARQMVAWGNRTKVEVTGMPRLDYLQRIEQQRTEHPLKRVLIMTAKKPAFTSAQMQTVIQSLRDLRDYFDSNPNVEVVWRLTKNLDHVLEVDNKFTDLGSLELVDVLKEVDAVICTPSTAMLETMILSKPLACLDYHNTPRFVNTAWTIASREHIPTVVEELVDPPVTKLSFQADCLNDALYHSTKTSAAERVARLIAGMVHVANVAKRKQVTMHFPANMLEFDMLAYCSNNPKPLESLYPTHPAFNETDLVKLQVRYARLLKDYEKQTKALRKRNMFFWIRRGIHNVTQKLLQ